MDRPGFTASLVAGGVAGVFVDLILFPLDTIKTRLQSPQGFYKAGGFYGVYAGVPSTAIGSFPNAAAFFVTYEYVKWILHTDSSSYLMPVTHMLAASAGEVVACLIRVPSEVVKQRAQVSASSGTFHIFSNILCQEGIQGLYRGYKSTVLREIPFSLVQFPLWESLKALWSWRQDHVVDSWQSAVCGAFAGWFQHREWEHPLCPARGLADTGAVGIICRYLPSHGSHQSGRFHLSWCLRPNSQLSVGTWQREPLNQRWPLPSRKDPAVRRVSLPVSSCPAI
ncbi:mitochondrial S-adenosylmethionine carrier protein isoform X4 [Bubalus kerabau]|uniref:S-adenosylmethionine mitochondrial carrier protein isoform X8 n=1 Tax=Bubalus bubalis TaxID=89462 RepID=UPI000DBC851D|nr:S-adenosylmethionine mitochondrial carrier protein isoform X8 [Bubalus bubalis]XP_055413170.1 S-adenosylmethionine mitochondrial carrier protein isoform X4 [Bubalus carabanensis]